MNRTTKQVLRYTLLPGILPRLHELMTGGFSHISLYLAQIYAAVRLLPPNHPYLNPANMGRFGVLNVIAAAGGRLRFRKENIDQLIVFFLLLSGIVVLVMQFVLLGFSIMVQGAQATALPTNFAGFFITPAPHPDDVAFVILERVFGVEESPGVGFFSSCVSQNVPCFQAIDNPYPLNVQAQPEGTWPWPFHLALHQMFQFYSIGLLVVGMLIFCYFVSAIVLETAQEGTPFGKRFNHVWAPIRMVVALGLLIPITNGLNSAQYITLWAVYWGSGFATNGWNLFVNTALKGPAPAVGVNTIAGTSDTLIASPEPPEMTNLIEFGAVLETCWSAYHKLYVNPGLNGISISAWLVKKVGVKNQQQVGPNDTYASALAFSDNHDIDIRFGECSATETTPGDPNLGRHVSCLQNCPTGGAPGSPNCPYDYPDEMGYVKPTCGEVVLPVVSSPDPTGLDPGGYYMQSQWWELISGLWNGSFYTAAYGAGYPAPGAQQQWVSAVGAKSQDPCVKGTPMISGTGYFTDIEQWGICIVDHFESDPPNPNVPIPTIQDIKKITNSDMTAYPTKLGAFEQQLMQKIIPDAVKLEATSTFWKYQLLPLGWAGAGVWYNKIANLNGNMIEAVEQMPYVIKYPWVMEQTRKGRAKADANNAGREQFRNKTTNNKTADELKADENAPKVARVLWQAYDIFRDAYNVRPSQNTFYDVLKWITGTRGLFALTDPANVNVHPLALLVGVGKSMFDAAIRNLGVSLGGSALSQILGANPLGLTDFAASIAKDLGMATLSIGMMLYYVVPFLPFLYFFFAVGTWVKGIFEAMVGVPLWALAHIHIDGDGLPGSFAMGGYYMIMEIFLRPITIVFGLLASITIFAAQVRVLNDIWSLVTTNLTGFNEGLSVTSGLPAGSTGTLSYFRDQIDQFFFTVIYAIVVYMLGMSSFKLITLIPAKVMRWMGATVDAFNDNEDIGQGLMGKMTAGASIMTNQVSQTWDGAGKSVRDGMAKDGVKNVPQGIGKDVQKLAGGGKPKPTA